MTYLNKIYSKEITMTDLVIRYLDETKDIHVEVDVYVEYYQPVGQGKSYGAMEDCYEDTDAEVEYTVSPMAYKHLEHDSSFEGLVLDLMADEYRDQQEVY